MTVNGGNQKAAKRPGMRRSRVLGGAGATPQNGKPKRSQAATEDRDDVDDDARDYPAGTSPGDDLWDGDWSDAGSPRRNVNDPYNTLWAISPERAWFRRRLRVNWLIGALIVLVVFAVLLATRRLQDVANGVAMDLAWIAAILAGITFAWTISPYFSARMSLRERRKHQAQYQAELALQDLSLTKDGHIPLERLYTMNRRQLDAYQAITKQQQRSAYRMAQVSSVVGLIILAGGATVAIRTTGTDAFLATGLTALGTTLSAFLGHTFLESHKRANEQLNKYADEPHLTGRMLSAERVARLPGWPPSNEQARLLLAAMLAASASGLSSEQKEDEPDVTDEAGGEEESEEATRSAGGQQ